jgi:L-methionine (R)-S-oxide reductase
MNAEAKKRIYDEARRELEAVLAGVADPITAMSTCVAVLHHRLPYASWTGFYRVAAPGLLRVGPYQGPLGCLEIPFDRGVCGAAARTGEAQVVPDVHAFPGHIACDAAARSEIVIPVRDAHGRLIAVLDVDSHQAAAFDEIDREGLALIAERLSACWGGEGAD